MYKSEHPPLVSDLNLVHCSLHLANIYIFLIYSLAWVLGESIFLESGIFFGLPPPPCFWLYKGKERGSIIFIRPLIPASSWEIFFFLSKKLLFEMFQEDQEDRHLRMTIFFVASISLCNARIRFTAKYPRFYSQNPHHLTGWEWRDKSWMSLWRGDDAILESCSCGWIVSSSQTLWVTREALQVYCKVALPKGLLSI